jgi:hypothetical protein
VGLQEVAAVYDAMITHRGMGPREVDELLIWEIAVALGVHKDGSDDDGEEAEPRHLARARQRARAMQGLGEMPEPSEPDKLAVATMTQALG